MQNLTWASRAGREIFRIKSYEKIYSQGILVLDKWAEAEEAVRYYPMAPALRSAPTSSGSNMERHATAPHYATEALLRDGSSVQLRAMRPDDKQRLRDLFSRLSARSVYFRFFQTKQHLTDEELQYFTELDSVYNMALVATLWEQGEEYLIAVGRYIALRDPAADLQRAEVAFAVADAHQGRGIGTLLLEHLAMIARSHGITEFEAYVLGENNRMLEVFEASGFRIKRSLDAGVFHVSFPTAETEQVRIASAQREHAATVQSVRAFLHPRSVAVVGASRRVGTIGNALLTNLQQHGFSGTIYAVHPQAGTSNNLPTFPTVSAIGVPVDLAVIAVPAPAVEAVVEDCARAGVRGLVVISSGFAEASEAGRQTENHSHQLVRASGMRLVGPNCMGLLNTDPAISLNATFAPIWPPAGNIGMLSQSGALGLAILDYVRTLNVGISTFISVGNKADVSSNDLLAYWADDPRTDVIVLYLESFGNPRKFARIAPEVARKKPIIAVKSGRSAAGTRAASSHSAALASLDVPVDALFEQAGVLRTNTLEELFDVAALLATQPVPQGACLRVVTNAGGPGIMLADACEAHGLALPELAPATRTALQAFLPAQAGLSNPVDMIASATPDQYRQTMAVVGADPALMPWWSYISRLFSPTLKTLPTPSHKALARFQPINQYLPSSSPLVVRLRRSVLVPVDLYPPLLFRKMPPRPWPLQYAMAAGGSNHGTHRCSSRRLP